MLGVIVLLIALYCLTRVLAEGFAASSAPRRCGFACLAIAIVGGGLLLGWLLFRSATVAAASRAGSAPPIAAGPYLWVAGMVVLAALLVGALVTTAAGLRRPRRA